MAQEDNPSSMYGEFYAIGKQIFQLLGNEVLRVQCSSQSGSKNLSSGENITVVCHEPLVTFVGI